MIYKNMLGGVILIIAGLFEMLVTPAILQNIRTRLPSFPHYAYLVRMTRVSGLIVAIVGILFLAGLLIRRGPSPPIFPRALSWPSQSP
jgi:hypothetical protein